MNIREMNISARAKSCLLSSGYKEIDDIIDLTENDLSKIHNINDKAIKEIINEVRNYKNANNEDEIDEERLFEFPESLYSLLQKPISLFFDLGKLHGFCCKHNITILREFCVFSEEELLSENQFSKEDVTIIIKTLNSLSLNLRPDKYDRYIYIYPISAKKYYFDKPDSWEYRLYNEAMICYYEWLQNYRDKECVLWEISKEEADEIGDCIENLDELKDFVSEELEYLMDIVKETTDAFNKTKIGFGKPGADGDAELLLESVSDFMCAYKKIIVWRNSFSYTYAPIQFHRVIEELVNLGNDILLDIDELYQKHLIAKNQFDEVEKGNDTEENLNIDFSISFSIKTAKLDVAIEELKNHNANTELKDNKNTDSPSVEEDNRIIDPFLNMFKDYKKL